jgi:hypothetical protein
MRYNLKVIFAGKFVWFFLAALGFFVFFMINNVWQGNLINEALMYEILFFPGVLLIFYPSVYGIQNDEDARILEILFGIPNYRYKVWLFRLLMVYLIFFCFLVLFAWIGTFLLFPVPQFEMAGQLMFPLLFLGNMAFMMSTWVRSGNATAVIMIIVGILMVVLTSAFGLKWWNITLNPFEVPENLHVVIWAGYLTKSRIFLAVGSVVFLLIGLLNLQKRERFV